MRLKTWKVRLTHILFNDGGTIIYAYANDVFTFQSNKGDQFNIPTEWIKLSSQVIHKHVDQDRIYFLQLTEEREVVQLFIKLIVHYKALFPSINQNLTYTKWTSIITFIYNHSGKMK